MFKTKRFCVLLVVTVMLLSISAFAYSGILDTFQGWDYSDVGSLAVDDFDLIDNDDIYVKIRIDDSQRWIGGGNAGMYVKPCKKNWLGVYKIQDSKSFTKSANDTSYSYLDFDGLPDGNYKILFKSIYQDSVDFRGTVYDNN